MGAEVELSTNSIPSNKHFRIRVFVGSQVCFFPSDPNDPNRAVPGRFIPKSTRDLLVKWIGGEGPYQVHKITKRNDRVTFHLINKGRIFRVSKKHLMKA